MKNRGSYGCSFFQTALVEFFTLYKFYRKLYSQKLDLEKSLRDCPGGIGKLVCATERVLQNRPAKKMLNCRREKNQVASSVKGLGAPHPQVTTSVNPRGREDHGVNL